MFSDGDRCVLDANGGNTADCQTDNRECGTAWCFGKRPGTSHVFTILCFFDSTLTHKRSSVVSDLFLQEPECLDQWHVDEEVSWMALESGSFVTNEGLQFQVSAAVVMLTPLKLIGVSTAIVHRSGECQQTADTAALLGWDDCCARSVLRASSIPQRLPTGYSACGALVSTPVSCVTVQAVQSKSNQKLLLTDMCRPQTVPTGKSTHRLNARVSCHDLLCERSIE